MRTGSIYIIRNTVNDKVYIGQTTMTVHERFMIHMKPSVQKMRRNYKLYNAVQKYGRDKFYVETLETDIPLDQINLKEIEYISKYDSFNHGYNSTKGGDGRIINKLDNEDKVLNMARNGVNSKEIAKMLHVNNFTVLRTLHKLGFYYYSNQDEIIKLYKLGMSNNEIASTLNCCSDTVSRALDRNDLRRHRKPIKCRNDFDIDNLIFDYNNQMPIKELCEKYNLSLASFYRFKKQHNIPTRPQIYKYKTRFFAN